MDDYMFRAYVAQSEKVVEETRYLEILNYSNPTFNSVEEHPLSLDEFDNFLHRRGAFTPPRLPAGVRLVHGVRMVIQPKAKHPDTFAPNYISLTSKDYESMVRAFHLPFRAIEGTSVVGPFFWSSYDQDDDDAHLQLIFRKSDVRKKGKTRGWELMLSHAFNTGMTTGFAKGTESSDIVASLAYLRECRAQAMHPMLLPTILLSHELPPENEQRQRKARDWLRHLENAITLRDEIVESDSYVKQETVDLDQINRDLVECHSQVLWKRPQAYQQIIEAFRLAMDRFWDRAKDKAEYGGTGGVVDRLHRSILGRLEFHSAKLAGIENYVCTTLERLTIQRAALYNIYAQKEARLNLDMAVQQRRLAHASKRDSNSTKSLSLLGAVFLPATYLASLFSMTFFNFQDASASGDTGGGGGNPAVSPFLWVYFAITIPITLVVVIFWRWWDKRRESLHAAEDVELEDGIEKLETQIIKTLRNRTLSKQRTWELGGKRE
ncbi:hypothetical protein P8C59_004686 [Phyllachora maydis]|uniref:Uncharacterized protein n=1 Tax=Phyllachora maydis TaxID=1825666 RepID=A0AAD9I450_9PEZI|nr:hypothetical protein P8C59_004686 [Phyllachora maydis]